MREYSNSQIRDVIMEWIHSERDQRILCLRFIRGWTLERIAEDTGMSVKQVQRIVYKLQEQVFKHI